MTIKNDARDRKYFPRGALEAHCLPASQLQQKKTAVTSSAPFRIYKLHVVLSTSFLTLKIWAISRHSAGTDF